VSAERYPLCIVVIGRNEGRRLRHSLSAAVATGFPVVYVDSASHDGSPALARQMGVYVHELDPAKPMSAARARNEGASQVLSLYPDAGYLQFVDGDTALHEDWCRDALGMLEQHPRSGIVFGSLREVAPQDSVYNRMCDREWNPEKPGAVTNCGGNMLVRKELFVDVNGFRTDIIDGEDIDFGGRVRARGFEITYVTQLMAHHDAALHSFWQWWRRCLRNGHGLAQLASIYGNRESRRIRSVVSALGWGFALPLAIVLAAVLVSPAALALFAVYPLQILRLYLKSKDRSLFDLQYALLTLIAKMPLGLGIMLYAKRRLMRQAPSIIEFK
jgi:GT2 family glycosyltransferase